MHDGWCRLCACRDDSRRVGVLGLRDTRIGQFCNCSEADPNEEAVIIQSRTRVVTQWPAIYQRSCILAMG